MIGPARAAVFRVEVDNEFCPGRFVVCPMAMMFELRMVGSVSFLASGLNCMGPMDRRNTRITTGIRIAKIKP